MARVTKTMEETFIDKEALATRWQVSVRTLEIWVKKRKCPKPVRLSSKCVRFRMSDVVAHENKNAMVKPA